MSQTRQLAQKYLLFECKVSMTVTYKKYIGRQGRIQDFQDFPTVWGENLLFGMLFAENCIEIKKIGPIEVYASKICPM